MEKDSGSEDNGMWNNSLIGPDSVQELSRTQTSEVPEAYIRHEHDRPYHCVISDSSFPRINLQNLKSPDSHTKKLELDKLAEASKEWGFFNLTNHGIPHQLMDRIMEAGKEFYNLPNEEKMKYKPKGTDPQGYGSSYIMDEYNKLNWSDVLLFIANPLASRDLSIWPRTPSDFIEIMERYNEEVQKVARDVLKALSQTLGLEDDCFVKMFGEDPSMLMRLNFYPVCPRPDLVIGLGHHTDGSAITMLLQDHHCVGLHVLKEGNWVSVPPVPYALVVNFGDLMEVMSNGRYKSVEHRAVPNSESERMSIAAFFSPGHEKVISPVEKLVEEDGGAVYKSLTYATYIHQFSSYPLKGKQALKSFAL